MDSKISLVLLLVIFGAVLAVNHRPHYSTRAAYRPTRAPSPTKITSYTISSWSDWGEYGTCTKSCGGGEEFRYRTCTMEIKFATARYSSGRYSKGPDSTFKCPGISRSMRRCNLHCCPVDGMWAEWRYWTSWTQGYGSNFTRTRYRTCEKTTCGGEKCTGDSTQSQSKNVYVPLPRQVRRNRYAYNNRWWEVVR